MKCLLCKDKEANQTGSHIFTHSLISKCINEEGKKGRDKEMMFGFSQSGAKSVFYGNGILLEKIQDISGKILTDEDIANNLNDFVEDNIYCKDCENLFGKVESAFASKILTNIRTSTSYNLEYPNNLLIRFLVHDKKYNLLKIRKISVFKFV